jgi:hypothetical protein
MKELAFEAKSSLIILCPAGIAKGGLQVCGTL